MYGGREGSTTQAAPYNAADKATYHNLAAAKLRLVYTMEAASVE